MRIEEIVELGEIENMFIIPRDKRTKNTLSDVLKHEPKKINVQNYEG